MLDVLYERVDPAIVASRGIANRMGAAPPAKSCSSRWLAFTDPIRSRHSRSSRLGFGWPALFLSPDVDEDGQRVRAQQPSATEPTSARVMPSDRAKRCR